ncbi:MAG TPA: ferritin-like domain-containing protein [Verrucomicrobiae bacterium]|jgi:ferritin-like metal-binding protein YciE|nr:ferritin-like domain-containing protein [Verrucomicrobiae bacterium]
MRSAHELFVHELQDMLDAEQQLVEALGKQAEESSRPELQKAFQSHQAQTEKQVERLHQVFESIDEEAEEVECKGIRGLLEEHDHFMEEEDPAEDIVDIFNVGAAEKVESYEICAYESLIRLAKLMGHTKAEKLLNQNLKEEQATLKKMQGFSKKLKPENLGMDDEEEDDDEGNDAEEMEETDVSEAELSPEQNKNNRRSNTPKKPGSRRSGSRRAA